MGYTRDKVGEAIGTRNGKDPPCYSWENPLFRLGHGFNVAFGMLTILGYIPLYNHH